MHQSKPAILLCCVLLFCSLGGAQQLVNVPASEAMRHVTKSYPPEYPTLASLAHITGRVIVQATISPEGKVTGARMITGHPLFQEAAERAVRAWRYEPFVVNGTPAPVNTLVYLSFWLGPDAQLRHRNVLQEVECRDLIQA